jgi:hypothetical protein
LRRPWGGLLAALIVLVLFPPRAPAQEPPGTERRVIQVPPRLFVGDQGRLIVDPGPELKGISPFVIDDPRRLPQGPDITLLRLELELQRGEERLLIDFTAFAPGRVELPPISLPQVPGVSLEGYRVSVASVLGNANPLNPRGTAAPPVLPGPQAGEGILILSNPAPPLAVPGTALLIYGTASLIVLALLLILGGGMWGRPYLERLLKTHRRRRLVRLMGVIGKRLREQIPRGACQEILRELSTEFRAFLGYFYDRAGDGPGPFAFRGRDCRAMTAAEFASLPPLFSFGGEDAVFPKTGGNTEDAPGPAERGEAPAPAAPPWAEFVSPPSLGNFFCSLDRLRFSGVPVEPRDISTLLDRLERILTAMDLGFREREPLAHFSRPGDRYRGGSRPGKRTPPPAFRAQGTQGP